MLSRMRSANKCRKYQSGNLYIIAIFVLVVMGFLASVLLNIEWSNNDSLVRKKLGAQAVLLAHSSNDYVLTQFYPLNSSTAISTLCTNPIPNALLSGATSLLSGTPECHTLAVNCTDKGALDGVQFYTLTSSVTCGNGIFETQRLQEVWLKE